MIVSGIMFSAPDPAAPRRLMSPGGIVLELPEGQDRPDAAVAARLRKVGDVELVRDEQHENQWTAPALGVVFCKGAHHPVEKIDEMVKEYLEQALKA